MSSDWSGTTRAFRLLAAALTGWLLIGAAPAVAQQEGAISGTVTDAESLEPVAGAQVFIPGTVIGTLTTERGTYRLEGVPTGEQRLLVQLIGYKDAEQAVTVEAGQVATADFQVQQTALRLQDIVVTGVIGETPRVKLPFTVERIDSEDMPVPSSNASTLLTGKASGMQVTKGSGQPGTAADILLRGPTSIDATGRTQGPLIVVDGVIQSENASLADINALDIDHVEVVKGAAAASLYGSRAQNGVIQISTKRGQDMAPNSFNVTVRNEYGLSQLENQIAVASQHPFQLTGDGAFITDQGGTTGNFSDIAREGVGNAVLDNEFGDTPGNTFNAFQDNPYPGQLRDHIEEFFDPGETWSNYVAASGRFGESSFRASFENFRETGIVSCAECPQVDIGILRGSQEIGELVPIQDDGYRRRNARLNVDTRAFGGKLDLAASGFYSNSSQADEINSGAGDIFFGLTFMSPAVDLTTPDENGLPRVDIDAASQEQNPLYMLAVRDYENRQQRVMGSLDAVYSFTDWFQLEGNASYDRTDFDRTEFHPKNEKQHAGGGLVTFTGGRLQHVNWFEQALNASLTASFNKALMDGDLTTRFKARYLVEDQNFELTDTQGGSFIVGGVPNFGAIPQATLDAINQATEIKAQGYFAIASLDYRGKYILDGLARRDGSSLFGPEERWHWYFRGSAAWRISQEGWWNLEPVDEFKLRYSYGTAGGRPNFFAQFETFGIAAGQVFPVNLGNVNLKPEFTIEQEAGANIVLFDRIGIDLTYAWATTDDQLLLAPQPGFLGFQAQWRNAGEIESETWEGSLRASLIDRSDMGLSVRLNLDKTDQTITRLDIPAYTEASAGAGGTFYVAEGEPLGAIWGHRWATSCAEMAPRGISASDCQANFQVNDDGYLVFTGGADFTQGIAQQLWGTSGTVAGESFGWGLPVVVVDKSPACLRTRPAAECSLSNFLPLGNTTPDFSGSFATNFRYKGFSLAGLVDAAVGMDIYNSTEQWAWRDGSHRGKDIDQGGKPDGLKKPLAYYSILYDTNATSSEFVQDGDWLKVRELSVGYSLPESVLQDLFGGALNRVSVNLIGRNLLTFTDYTGYDPEVGFDSDEFGSTGIQRDDAFTYPNFRTFTASLEVVF